MKLFLLACAGGAIGAGLRYLLNTIAVQALALNVSWATFAINVLGSLAMGGIIAYISQRTPDALAIKVFLTTGLLGGFTTFSAFSLETILLFERGSSGAALIYVTASVALSIAACTAGYLGIRALIL